MSESDGGHLAVPGEPVISTPQELIDAFAAWLTEAPPEETGEFVHRLIDHMRSRAAGEGPCADGGLVLDHLDSPAAGTDSSTIADV